MNAIGQLGGLAQGFVVTLDLIYKFFLLEGTVDDPKKFRIIPDIKIPFTCIRLELKGCLENRKLTFGRPIWQKVSCYLLFLLVSSQSGAL